MTAWRLQVGLGKGGAAHVHGEAHFITGVSGVSSSLVVLGSSPRPPTLKHRIELVMLTLGFKGTGTRDSRLAGRKDYFKL
jgi:hypothetical protein